MSHFPKPVDVLHYTVRDFVNMSTITVLEMGGLSRWAQSNTRALTSGEHFLVKIRRHKSETEDGSERCPSVTWRQGTVKQATCAASRSQQPARTWAHLSPTAARNWILPEI